ncbi:MAG: hypothetical protein J1F06_00660 [Prevotellaceae bacterium]|nr:hypothetical protein [Prevotellaceae bacterium]
MTRKKHSGTIRTVKPSSAHGSGADAGKSLNNGKRKRTLTPATIYTVGFLLTYWFCALTMGDVFARAEQESFFTFDAMPMKYVLDQPLGHYWWGSRFLLLAYKSKWAGALCLSLLLTLTAWLFDRALRMPRLAGLGFLFVVAQLGWFAFLGTNVYHKNEPGIVFGLPVAVLFAVVFAACLSALARRGQSTPAGKPFAPLCGGLAALFVALIAVTAHFDRNQILTARLQLMMQEGRWEEMADEAVAAKRPTRAVAAYGAIGMLQRGELAARIFDITFDYPDPRLFKSDGNEEQAIFTADCNFHAGLVQAAYHHDLEQTVMNGPSVYRYKRMALSAVLMGETKLAERYFNLLAKVPFEKVFVEKYRPMNGNPELASEDSELATVMSLRPAETGTFEQNYRQPAFLGYNIGLMQGTDATLLTSAVACLYSKDLPRFAQRAEIMTQKGMSMPAIFSQALQILAMKDPQAKQFFAPYISQFTAAELSRFVQEARPVMHDKAKMRRQLKKNWLGTYYYYYYCENNEQHQTRQTESDGVN